MEPFLADDTVRLEIDGTPVFTYDAATCQLSYNEQRREFRAMNDTMLDYFCITLTAIPAREGDMAAASIVWSTPDGERTRNDVTLEAKRIKGDVIWLCNGNRHTAAVVNVLK
jgi:hypothetical protein